MQKYPTAPPLDSDHDFGDILTPLGTGPLFQSNVLSDAEESRLGQSLQYALTNRYTERNCRTYTKNALIGVAVVLVGVAGGLLYGKAAIELSEEQMATLGWEIITTASAFGTNALGTALWTVDTLTSQLNAIERRITGNEGRLCRLFTPLGISLFIGLLPATSYFASFLASTDVVRWGMAFLIGGSIATLLANYFSSIFTVRNYGMDLFDFLYSKLACSQTVKSQYLLSDRYLSLVGAVQQHIARRASRARRTHELEFPAELECLTFTSRESANQLIAAITGYERKYALNQPTPRADKITRLVAHAGGITAAVFCVCSQMGSFWATEKGFEVIAASVNALSWLNLPGVKYSLSAIIDMFTIVFTAGLSHSFGYNVVRTGINMVRGRFNSQNFDISYLWHIAPKLFATDLGLAVLFGAFSFALSVKLNTMVPIDYKLLDFIVITEAFRDFCTRCAYVCTPIVNTYAGHLAFDWAFKKLAPHLGSENEKKYAKILVGLDTHKRHVDAMPKKVFGADLELLEHINCYIDGEDPMPIAEAIGAGIPKLHDRIRSSQGHNPVITDATPLRPLSGNRASLLNRIGDSDDEPMFGDGATKKKFCIVM